MDFTFNRNVLAKLVFDSIKKGAPRSRVELNQEFKSSNNQKKTDALNDVIRSLIAYDHIDRHLDPESNALYLWPKGVKVRFDPMNRPINKNGVEDYLAPVSSRSVRCQVPQETEVEERLATPALIPVGAGDTLEDEEDGTQEQPQEELTIPAIDTFKSTSGPKSNVLLKDKDGEPASLYHQAKVLPLDRFIEHLATSVESFTRADLDDYLGPNVAKNVISTRLAIVCRKGIVEPFMQSDEVRYALPVNVPKNCAKPPVEAKEPVTRRRLNSAVVTTKLDAGTQEPEASFSLKYGFMFFREDGELLNLSVKEQRALFKFFALTNPQALLDNLNEQES